MIKPKQCVFTPFFGETKFIVDVMTWHVWSSPKQRVFIPFFGETKFIVDDMKIKMNLHVYPERYGSCGWYEALVSDLAFQIMKKYVITSL